MILPGHPLVANRPKMIADLWLKYRMPVLTDNKEFVEAGGLLSLGLDLVESYRRAATHVDKILKGATIDLRTDGSNNCRSSRGTS